MQMAGHTLSVAAAFRRSLRLLKPSRSQSVMSFAALFERAMVDMTSSSLPAPEPFGWRFARRKPVRGYSARRLGNGGDPETCHRGTLFVWMARCCDLVARQSVVPDIAYSVIFRE